MGKRSVFLQLSRPAFFSRFIRLSTNPSISEPFWLAQSARTLSFWWICDCGRTAIEMIFGFRFDADTHTHMNSEHMTMWWKATNGERTPAPPQMIMTWQRNFSFNIFICANLLPTHSDSHKHVSFIVMQTESETAAHTYTGHRVSASCDMTVKPISFFVPPFLYFLLCACRLHIEWWLLWAVSECVCEYKTMKNW